ncbi:MAG: peptidoglycan DD-metalloendopeptidase family protein [Dehalococcoidia bacterium]|nr:peptidoglycan DD-metalloendopeptidase family protein [Dehalococcoidia bacterium]
MAGARFTIAAPANGYNASLKVSTFSLPGLAASIPTDTVGAPVTPPAVAVTVVPAAEQPPVVVSAEPVSTPESVRQVSQAVVEGTAVPAAAAPVRASRTQEPVLKYYQYQVQPGDTVNAIASRSGIDPKYILWNNIDIISNEHVLTVGDILMIPAVEGILHPVRIGDTLSGIATQYDAKVADIVAFAGNGLANPGDLKEGSIILVPGGRMVDRSTPGAPTAKPTPPPQAAAQPTAAAAAAGSSTNAATGWIWPVVNSITSYFGPSHPLGIDIEAPYVPVVASRAGQVVFVGGDPCCSYGLYVIIRHDGEYETRYAHLSQFSVQLGQWVDAGQQIGISGSTGRSTGAHLHFEVIYNGSVINPLTVLP